MYILSVTTWNIRKKYKNMYTICILCTLKIAFVRLFARMHTYTTLYGGIHNIQWCHPAPIIIICAPFMCLLGKRLPNGDGRRGKINNNKKNDNSKKKKNTAYNKCSYMRILTEDVLICVRVLCTGIGTVLPRDPYVSRKVYSARII